MNRIAWMAFASMLLFAVVFFANSTSSLPPLVASHFDGSGYPTAYMSRDFYTKFVFFMRAVLPIVLVALTGYGQPDDRRLAGDRDPDGRAARE